MRFLMQWLCGRKGHHYVFKVDNVARRVFPVCLKCGKESPGYKVTGQPRKRF